MPIVILILIAGAAAILLARFLARRNRRRVLLETPLSDHQRNLLAKHVPLLARLPDDLRAPLEGKINLFLDQVDFHGCDGLETTEEMRLAIAAQACLLVVNTRRWYKTLRTVLIYPGAFKSVQETQHGDVVHVHDQVRLGESWTRGPVILSWPHSEQGARNDVDGHNVVLHEFAHQIDALSGHVDGAPLLSSGQSFREWERVILKAYEEHNRHLEAGRKTILDDYAASAHEEFFAVAVEVFFEKPARFRDEEPEVYDQLAKLFRLDPAEW